MRLILKLCHNNYCHVIAIFNQNTKTVNIKEMNNNEFTSVLAHLNYPYSLHMNILELCSCHALLNKAFYALIFTINSFIEQLPLKHAMLSQFQMQPLFDGMTQF